MDDLLLAPSVRSCYLIQEVANLELQRL